MKNLNKRAKIILAIVGIVVVVAVIGLVITQPPANALFGASVLNITPTNPTIAVGGSTGLFVSMASPYCQWSSSNPAVAYIGASQGNVGSVFGKAAGSATITVTDCIPGAKGTTTVTVLQPQLSPANPSVDVGKTITLQLLNVPTGTNPNCTWTSSSTLTVRLSNATANSVVVKGYQTGSADITAKCSTGNLTTHVTMTNPASPTPEVAIIHRIVYFSPTTQTLKVGASVTMRLLDFEGTNWSACTDRSDLVTISNKVLTTDTQGVGTLTFMVTGKAVGQAKIRDCPADPNQGIELMYLKMPTCMVDPNYGTVVCNGTYDQLIPPNDATITVQ